MQNYLILMKEFAFNLTRDSASAM